MKELERVIRFSGTPIILKQKQKQKTTRYLLSHFRFIFFYQLMYSFHFISNKDINKSFFFQVCFTIRNFFRLVINSTCNPRSLE